MIGFKICKTSALSFRNRATDFQYNSVLFLHDREFGSNPFQPNVAFHIEISYMICIANQMTGFIMKSNTRLKWVELVNGILMT